jgi:hypothetical protein
MVSMLPLKNLSNDSKLQSEWKCKVSQSPDVSLVYTNRAIVNPQQFAGVKHIQITNSVNNSFCFTVEPVAAMRENEMGFNVPMVSMTH